MGAFFSQSQVSFRCIERCRDVTNYLFYNITAWHFHSCGYLFLQLSFFLTEFLIPLIKLYEFAVYSKYFLFFFPPCLLGLLLWWVYTVFYYTHKKKVQLCFWFHFCSDVIMATWRLFGQQGALTRPISCCPTYQRLNTKSQNFILRNPNNNICVNKTLD